MKVLIWGYPSFTVYNAICPKCNSKIEFNDTEIKKDELVKQSYIICPVCNTTILNNLFKKIENIQNNTNTCKKISEKIKCCKDCCKNCNRQPQSESDPGTYMGWDSSWDY